MSRLLKKLWTDESAISATEYAIIAAIIGGGLIGVIVIFRDKIKHMFTKTSNEMDQAVSK